MMFCETQHQSHHRARNSIKGYAVLACQAFFHLGVASVAGACDNQHNKLWRKCCRGYLRSRCAVVEVLSKPTSDMFYFSQVAHNASK